MVYVDEDYEMFHLVLTYLYNDRIHFTTLREPKTDPEAPMTCDAEGVYAISRRLKVESLQRKAFHFLQATTNLQNVTARVFGKFAAEHMDIQKWYDEYFIKHYKEIKQLPEHNFFLTELIGTGGEFERVMVKFWEMV